MCHLDWTTVCLGIWFQNFDPENVVLVMRRHLKAEDLGVRDNLLSGIISC